MSRRIRTVFLFPNGSVTCTDVEGQQVAEWQANLFCDHLYKMREAGVIDDDTEVQASSGMKKRVGDWIGGPK